MKDSRVINTIKNHKILTIIIALLLAAAITASVLLVIYETSPRSAELSLQEEKLMVHFIDVGQGDCILLESRGEFVLVDAGEREYGPAVTEYIRGRGATSLKYVIATHPHSDHVGGLTQVINSIRTENFITSETDQNTRTWLNVLEAVDKNNVNYIDAEAGSTYSFGESSFTILAPLGDEYNDYNNYSVVTKAVCGSVSFLLTGDAAKQSEKEMLSSGEDLSATVLKCGHHGSAYSSTAKFLKAVDPDYAVIMCGKNNDYGHPHKETLKKLDLLGCPYLRTDELGTIIASTNGKRLDFYTLEGEVEPTSPTQPAEPGYYIGNKNSRVFHRPDCGGVKTMSDKNKVTFSSRDEAAAAGYSPCSQCEP